MKHKKSLLPNPAFKDIIIPNYYKIYFECHRPDIVELERIPIFAYPKVGTGHSKARISNRIY